MERTVYNGTFPITFGNVLGLVDACLVLVISNEQGVEGSVNITERCGPLSLAVGITAVTQVIDIIILKEIINLTYQFPVNQVLGVHNGSTRAEIHGGAYHIVIITYSDPVIIRYIGISKRVDTFSLLVFSSTA